jgi:TonB family protein
VIVNARRPIWRYAPRAERLAEYYPASALDRGREGEASLHCIIGEKGALDCERVSEYPERAGFGLAALKVARTLRHAEQRADGRSAIGTPIDLRVVFRMPEGERREGRSRS